MNQSAYQAITAMLNAFPQSAGDAKALLLTYEKALTGLSDQAVTEAAMRFIQGDVKDQSKRFAPSVAEFVTEARVREEYIEIRNRPRLPGPKEPAPYANWVPPTPEEKARVAAKMEQFRKSMPPSEAKPEFDWSRVNARFDKIAE